MTVFRNPILRFCRTTPSFAIMHILKIKIEIVNFNQVEIDGKSMNQNKPF